MGSVQMSKQIAIMKLLPSLEIAGCINELLRELQSRGDYILDYENCDMSLDHVEYHKLKILMERSPGTLRITCTAFSRWCEHG